MALTKSEVIHHLVHARGHLQSVQTGEGVPAELRSKTDEMVRELQWMLEDVSNFLFPDLGEREE